MLRKNLKFGKVKMSSKKLSFYFKKKDKKPGQVTINSKRFLRISIYLDDVNRLLEL